MTIYWGAYLGTPDEILVSGPLAEVADEVVRRARRGPGAQGLDVRHLPAEPPCALTRPPTRVLVLAGTAEAAALAGRLVRPSPAYEVTASLAGHTRRPRPAVPGAHGRLRGRGRAGRPGCGHGTGALVDATHPFAAIMPHHAAGRGRRAGRAPRPPAPAPLGRPSPATGGIEVDDLAEAAATVTDLGARRVLLTTGRLELAPFAVGRASTRFVVRTIEPPEPLPWPVRGGGPRPRPVHGRRRGRAPAGHDVDAVVTKNSGGEATAAKLTAARSLGVPVVMVRRPPAPPGAVVSTAAEALAWLREVGPPAAG